MRAGSFRYFLAIGLLALVAVGCGGSSPNDPSSSFTAPITFDELDLSSPRTAVDAFVSAYINRDYITAALILHPATQRTINEATAADDLSTLITADAETSTLARIAVERGRDQVLDGLRVFEIAMEQAMENGGFRVDLASGVEAVTLQRADQFTAVVQATLSANGLSTTFDLAATEDGRWRIRGARVGEGTPIDVPFSGDPLSSSPRRSNQQRDVWRSSLPSSSPQELLDTISAVVASGDHVSLYLLLDEVGQQGAIDQLARAVPTFGDSFAAVELDEHLDAEGFPTDLSTADSIAAEIMQTSVDVGPNEALTFLVATEDGDLDVTMSRDSAGNWRLRRMVNAGDLTAPSPFIIG